MNKKKLVIASGIILVLGTFTTFAVVQSQSDQSQTVEVVRPSMESLKSEVMLPGTVKTEDTELIYLSPELGETYELLVEEGDQVAEGAELVRYAQDQLESEQEKLALQIEAGYLQINFLEDQEKGLNDQEDDLKDELGEDEAEETVKTERDQLAFEKKSANLDLRQLLLQEDELEQQKEDLLIKSTIAGTVLSAESNPVEQQPIMEIATTDQLIIEGTLSEYDSLVVAEGQNVAITSDAQPDQEWSGSVGEIGFMPNEADAMGGETERTEYPLKVSIDEGDLSSLMPGYKLILKIATEEKEALTIPQSAVVTEDDVQYVFVIEEGKATRKEVELGIQSGQSYEVINGADESTEVIMEAANIQEGSDVSIND